MFSFEKTFTGKIPTMKNTIGNILPPHHLILMFERNIPYFRKKGGCVKKNGHFCLKINKRSGEKEKTPYK
jgi:hypothetical protein